MSSYTINTSFRVEAYGWFVIPGVVLSEGGKVRLMRQSVDMPENGRYRREQLRGRHGSTAWFLGNYYGVLP